MDHGTGEAPESPKVVNKQALDAADLALFGIAVEWKAAQMEATTEVFQVLKLFKAAFVKCFAIQQSSAESIKLVMELKQKTDEKVRDFFDRVVSNYGTLRLYATSVFSGVSTGRTSVVLVRHVK